MVCEDLGQRTGSLLYLAPDGALLALLNKTAEPMYNNANTTSPVHPPRPPSGADPSLPAYMAATPPMIYMGGYNVQDPLNCVGKASCKVWDPMAAGGWNVHTFVGSRSSSVKATFDALGSSPSNFGSPDMNPWPGKYGRSSAVWKDPINYTDQREGLWGGHLPIVTFQHTMLAGSGCKNCSVTRQPCPNSKGHTFCPTDPAPKQCQQPPCNRPNSEAGWIEWVAVPVPDMEGSKEQDVFYRMMKIAQNGTVIDARFWDTYSFLGTEGPDLPDDVNYGATITGMGSPAGSDIAVDFYAMVLEQQRWWDAEFRNEGVMQFELPRNLDRSGTDGLLLHDQALHVLVRDMIFREDTWFPQYGLLPLWYGQPRNHGCPLVFVMSMYGALELGAFEYARGVLDNWLHYFIRKRGFATPEGVSSGADIWAMYSEYTGDYDLLLKYYDKVMQYPRNIRALRKRAKGLGKDHPAYGLPAGTENGDMYDTAIGCGTTYGEKAAVHNYDGVITGDIVQDCHTTAPKYDIAFDTVRCFEALGPVLEKIGAKHNRPDIISEGQKLSQEAQELLEDINNSLDKVAIHNVDEKGEKGKGNLTCYPTWPGAGTCGGGAESWGGAVKPTSGAVCKQSSKYHQPSLDMCGGGTAPGDPKPTPYTYPGAWSSIAYIEHPGWSELMNDDPVGVLAALYFRSANHMSRGTWTSTEELGGYSQALDGRGVPRGGAGSGITPWTGMQYAVQLKEILLWTHPDTKTTWIGRAIPREWLNPGQRVSLTNATTAFGRLSFTIEAAAATVGHFHINITLSERFATAPPSGGIALRVRAPGYLEGKKITHAAMGGKPLSATSINATAEAIMLSEADLRKTADLQSIAVTVA